MCLTCRSPIKTNKQKRWKEFGSSSSVSTVRTFVTLLGSGHSWVDPKNLGPWVLITSGWYLSLSLKAVFSLVGQYSGLSFLLSVVRPGHISLSWFSSSCNRNSVMGVHCFQSVIPNHLLMNKTVPASDLAGVLAHACQDCHTCRASLGYWSLLYFKKVKPKPEGITAYEQEQKKGQGSMFKGMLSSWG